jgi:hypothetical protein
MGPPQPLQVSARSLIAWQSAFDGIRRSFPCTSERGPAQAPVHGRPARVAAVLASLGSFETQHQAPGAAC